MFVNPSYDFTSRSVCAELLQNELAGLDARKIHEWLLKQFGLKKNVSMPYSRYSETFKVTRIVKPSYMGKSLVMDLENAINDGKIFNGRAGSWSKIVARFMNLADFVHHQWTRSPRVCEAAAIRFAEISEMKSSRN